MKQTKFYKIVMSLLVIFPFFLSAQNFTQGLIAHWKFENNATDETAFGNNGTATNTTTIAGYANQSYQFNSNSRVTVPNSASLSAPTTAFSTAFWVKINQFAPFPYAPIFCKSDVEGNDFQYALWISANLINFQVNDYTTSNVTIPYNFATNTWYHVAVTYQAGLTALYVNGTAIGTATGTLATAILPNSKPLVIGANAPGSLEYFSGALDNLRLYGRTLSALDVASLYLNERVLPSTDCAAKSLFPWEFWINNVKFNTLNNTSDKFKDYNTFGFSDYSNLSTTVNRGQTHPLSITPGLSWVGNLSTTYCRAWIDFNNNKTYEANELVLEKNNANPLTANVLIPSAATIGAVKMRVAFKNGSYPTACETFDKGEVEDYTVNIQNGIVVNLPDLTTSISSATIVGQEMRFSATIKNIGTVNADNVQYTLFYSDDTIPSSDDTGLPTGGCCSNLTLLPNGAYNFTGAVAIPIRNQYFIVVADYLNLTPESNDRNNISYQLIQPVVVNNSCRYQDSLQLVSLYNATNGANWTTKWNLATPIHTWFGVTLNANGCVSGLLMMGNNLVGTLPNLSLSALTFMNLNGNQLSGAIPNFTGLPLLEELVLYNNKLIGTIPNLNLPKLKFLILYNNQLSGTVPNLNLPNLLQFDANTNKLSGTLPNFNLPQLTRLDFQGNLLTGSIPNFNLPNLQGLTLIDNLLTGAIPNFNLPRLTDLNLDKNQLSGTIPSLSLPSLTTLSLSNNKLTGSIPLFTIPNIVRINLSNNQLSSCLPVYLIVYCGKSVDISGNPLLFNQNFATFCSNEAGSCNAPLPDFRMTAITQAQGSDLTTTTYRPGIDGFGVNYTVVNSGGVYTSPVTAFIYLSKDTILDSRDSFFTKLLAGATGTYLAGGTVPNLPDGDYFLIGKANGDNAIPETNANNNTFVLKTPKVKIRSTNVADLNVLLSTNRGFYQPFTTLTYLLVVENRGTTPFSNIKVEFKFPANTVSGGTAVPTVGTWQEWCAGGVQCYTWTIPSIAAGANAQLNVPLFILNTTAPIVATAKLLSSTPVDANTVNNSASYTITQAPVAPTTQGLAFQVPTQLIPVVIQRLAPNPTAGELIVKLDSWKEQEVDFNFSDITGKTIHSEKRTLEKGVNRVGFDVYHLPQGVYLIQTNVGKGKNVPTKFVKM